MLTGGEGARVSEAGVILTAACIVRDKLYLEVPCWYHVAAQMKREASWSKDTGLEVRLMAMHIDRPCTGPVHRTQTDSSNSTARPRQGLLLKVA